MDYADFYRGKTVLVTGHTGFKGSWLSLWLESLGAKVVGYALDPIYQDGVFGVTNLGKRIVDVRGDVRNLEELRNAFSEHDPDVVFHLAAQPLVLESYDDPVTTFTTNVIGTTNVLECVRKSNTPITVAITSDKCYANKEHIWGYKENDELGGVDPYSASKSCAEHVVNSYTKSFFSGKDIRCASARAGNVIGGGDWSRNRIVPDVMRALLAKTPVQVRNPSSTRPWQHVLDPLNGYLLLGARLSENDRFEGPWNFGPTHDSIITVREVVERIIRMMGEGSWNDISGGNAPHETRFLSLDSSKSYFHLGWKPVLDIDTALRFVVEWYGSYNSSDAYVLCKSQIEEFMALSKKSSPHIN